MSPPLVVSNVPVGTQSLALLVHDPDAPRGDWLHWLAWNIPAKTVKIGTGSLPYGAITGINDFGTIGYDGPQPPSGTHRYVFELYALSEPLDLPPGAGRTQFTAAIAGHVVATTQLVGLYPS